jgi:hypothetical protein
MVFNLMKLPTLFPRLNFDIGYKPALETERKAEVHG